MSFLCRRVEYALGKEKAARRVQEEKEVRARWEKCRLARTGRERSTRQMGKMPPGAYRKRKKYAPEEKNTAWRVQLEKVYNLRKEHVKRKQRKKEQ